MFNLRAQDSFVVHILSLSAQAKRGLLNGKIRAADESYAQEMNIITIIIKSCKLNPA